MKEPTAVVVHINDGPERTAEVLETLGRRARERDVTGIVAVVTCTDGTIEHVKVNVPIDRALGLHARAMHWLHNLWSLHQ